MLQHGVGRRGRAVQYMADVCRPAARRLSRFAQAGEEADARIGRGARRFNRVLGAGRLVDRDDIGKRAAGIDRNTKIHALPQSLHGRADVQRVISDMRISYS